MFLWLNPNRSEQVRVPRGICCLSPALTCAQYCIPPASRAACFSGIYPGRFSARIPVELSMHMGYRWWFVFSYDWGFFAFLAHKNSYFFPPGEAEHKAVLQNVPFYVLMSYTRFPSSPRDIRKISFPVCLDLSWFIDWEAVVERIRGKFQRAFPEGIVPSPVSCLMLSSSDFFKGEIYP